MQRDQPTNNRLARKLMISVIVSSTLITLITTVYQLYGLYSRDRAAIDVRLNEIKEVHLDSIAHALWNADYGELKIRMESMINLPDMLHIEVRERANTIVSVGNFQKDQVVQKKFKIMYFYKNENREIGDLIVQFDLNKIYNRVWNQLIDILIGNSLKTFIISFVILWIFYQLVSKRIKELSEHFSDVTTEDIDDEFLFSNRTVSPEKIDELDVLANSYNEMKKKVSTSLKDLERNQSLIREREQFYNSILDMNSAVIFVKDVAGKFVFVNRKFGEIIDRERSEILNKTVHDVFENEIAGLLIKNDKAVVNAHVAIEFVEVLPVKGNTHTFLSMKFPLFNKQNEIYAIGCVATDINKLIITQKELESKTIELENSLNSLIDGVITINEDFTISNLNHAAENILGYRKSEIEGKEISVLMRDEDKSRFLMIRSSLLRMLSERIIGTSREFYARKKNGKEFPLQLSINRLPDDREGNKRFIASFIDLTEIEEKEALMRQSMKLEALGNLTSGIAHDYNNMLGVVQGYAELVKLKYKNDKVTTEYLDHIMHACERGSKLSKKMLAFSSYHRADSRVVNLKHVLNEMKDMLERTLTARIHLEINVIENIWPVFVDDSELEDAILNMCINALHAMPGGGSLSIDVVNIELDCNEAKLFEVKQGEYVRFSIIDSGVGMTSDVQKKIFDPFYTTKGSEGTGLGLSQVYGFCKRSGGTISVKSTPGAGTRFVMYFPRYETGHLAQEYSSDTTEKKESADYSGCEKILIVDDEESLCILNKDLLEAYGYEVHTVSNGIAAISELERNNYSLVLSDLIMPEMDGYELANYVREYFPATKIQLLSGYHEDKNKNLDSELKDCLLYKPIKHEDLLKRVRELLDEEV